MKGRWLALHGWLAIGLAFLYLPIGTLVLESFNASRIGAHWGGFSLRWYRALLEDPALTEAALRSLGIAVMSASAASVLGAAAGIALGRLGGFTGRALLAALLLGPLAMPEVITGISLLLFFVNAESLGLLPGGRGLGTIVIAHTTFCAAYVAVVVHARLATMDRSLEEAAMDLGARPLRVLLDITLPGLAPALLAGWLLAFTLSLDDLVISGFVAGPGATTLPMLVYSKVKLGVTPDINALATLLIAAVAAGIALAGAWQLFRTRRTPPTG